MSTAKSASVSDANTLAAALAVNDQFPVGWAGRTKDGHLGLKSSVFKVQTPPPEMFGQNIRDFGFSKAVALAEEEGTPKPHDFGACYVRRGSLRKEEDGRWYIDLTVAHARKPICTVALVDDNGDFVLDEEGEVQLRTGPRKESWITCELSMLEPMLDHYASQAYVQSDRREAAQVRSNAQSVKLATGKKSGKAGRKKGKRARLTPEQIAALTAE